MSWIISVLVLGTLVLVHELGHFLVARWSGVRVTSFSIGFGPKLWGWKRGGTEYIVSALPLGGYVKMAGEHRSERQAHADEFLSQPPGVRARIIVAGPLVNYLTSIVSLWVVLVIGYPELLPTVGRLIDGMPAKAAGFVVGDRITAIDGHAVKTWDEMTKLVHESANHPLAFAVTRAGASLTMTVTPQAKTITDPFGRSRAVGLVGIAPDSEAFEPYRVGPIEAIGKMAEKQLEWTTQIGLSLWSLATGRISPKDSLTGPIGIIYMTSEAARMGLGSLLYLVSVFSLSLAIFNLFPIPILDGGHLLFVVLEKLRGRPVSMNVQERATQVSLALLLTMVALVCLNDLSRFGLVSKFLGLWKG